MLVYVPAPVSGGSGPLKWGWYKLIHLVSYGLIVLATGLYINLDEEGSLSKIIKYQIIAGWGSRMLVTTILPAAQAGLPTTDAMPASALGAQSRSFGSTWQISVVTFGRLQEVKEQVVRVHSGALRLAWYVCTAFSAFALLIELLEKNAVMRTTLEAPQKRTTEYRRRILYGDLMHT